MTTPAFNIQTACRKCGSKSVGARWIGEWGEPDEFRRCESAPNIESEIERRCYQCGFTWTEAYLGKGTMTPKTIARLRALETKATPRPWKPYDDMAEQARWGRSVADNANFQIEAGPGDWGGFFVVQHFTINRYTGKHVKPSDELAFLVALRNYAPALFDAAERAVKMEAVMAAYRIARRVCPCNGACYEATDAAVAALGEYKECML